MAHAVGRTADHLVLCKGGVLGDFDLCANPTSLLAPDVKAIRPWFTNEEFGLDCLAGHESIHCFEGNLRTPVRWLSF